MKTLEFAVKAPMQQLKDASRSGNCEDNSTAIQSISVDKFQFSQVRICLQHTESRTLSSASILPLEAVGFREYVLPTTTSRSRLLDQNTFSQSRYLGQLQRPSRNQGCAVAHVV